MANLSTNRTPQTMRIDLPQPNRVPFIVRLVYLTNRILPSRDPLRRFGCLLDLEWVLARLCHEYSLRVMSPLDQPHTGEAIAFLSRRIDQTHRVLDIGCATGVIAAGVAEFAADVVGIDRAVADITAANSEHLTQNLSFEVGDAFDYLLATSSETDVVILSHVLEHGDEPGILLTRIARRCRFLYLEVPDFDHSALNRHREHLRRELIYQDPDHRYEFDRADIRSLLEKSYLRVLDLEYRYGVQRYWCESVQGQGSDPSESAPAVNRPSAQ